MRECAAYSVADATTGERLAVAIVLDADVEISVADVADALVAAGLPKYKLPEELVFWDEPLPVNANGKVARNTLHARSQGFPRALADRLVPAGERRCAVLVRQLTAGLEDRDGEAVLVVLGSDSESPCRRAVPRPDSSRTHRHQSGPLHEIHHRQHVGRARVEGCGVLVDNAPRVEPSRGHWTGVSSTPRSSSAGRRA